MKSPTVIDLGRERAGRGEDIIRAAQAVFSYAHTGRASCVATVAICNDLTYASAFIPERRKDRLALIGALDELKAAILASEPGLFEAIRKD